MQFYEGQNRDGLAREGEEARTRRGGGDTKTGSVFWKTEPVCRCQFGIQLSRVRSEAKLLAWEKAFIRSWTVSFFFSSPDTSRAT